MAAVLIHYVVPAIHVFACLFLIVVVLLQTGKGADMGAVFGGGSQTLFGSSGAGNFLTKLTTGTAIAFMITSLILTYGATRAPTSRLLNRLPAPAVETETVPVAPGPEAGAESEALPGAAAEGQAPAEAPEAATGAEQRSAPAEAPAEGGSPK